MRTMVISRRVFWQMRNNIKGMVVLFALPILIVSLIGFSVIYPFEGVKVAVVNLDEGYDLPSGNGTVHLNMGSAIVSRINTTRLDLIMFNSTTSSNPYADAMEMLREGKVRAVVFFSVDFTKWALFEMNLTDDRPYSSFVYRLTLDDSYTPLALYIAGEINSAVQKTVQDFFVRGSAENLMQEFSLVERNSVSNDSYITAIIMVVTVFTISLFNSSIIMLRERTHKTMERLVSSKMSLIEFYAGFSLTFLIITATEVLIFLAMIATVSPDIPLSFSRALVITLCLILFGLVVQNTGMLISFLFKRDMDVVMSLPAVLMLSMMLGNVFYPPESFTGVVSLLTRLNSMTYAIHSILFLLSGGAESAVVADLMVLCLLFVASFALLFLLLRRVFVARR